MKSYLKILAPVAAIGVIGLLPGVATAQAAGTSYQAQLNEVNSSGASGSVTLQLEGNTATINENVSGLAPTFMDAPFPHVQHIHGLAMGQCPAPSADTNGDGVVSTTEGGPAYGMIQTTLSLTGDSSPAAATDVKVAPSGAGFTYSRTLTLSADSVKAIKGGTAVVVVHGIDPSKLSPQAQAEKSSVAPTLPLAATAPALCGALKVSQMSAIPSGAADTGNGSSATDNAGLVAGGAAALAVAAVGGVAFTRRRRTDS